MWCSMPSPLERSRVATVGLFYMCLIHICPLSSRPFVLLKHPDFSASLEKFLTPPNSSVGIYLYQFSETLIHIVQGCGPPKTLSVLSKSTPPNSPLRPLLGSRNHTSLLYLATPRQPHYTYRLRPLRLHHTLQMAEQGTVSAWLTALRQIQENLEDDVDYWQGQVELARSILDDVASTTFLHDGGQWREQVRVISALQSVAFFDADSGYVADMAHWCLNSLLAILQHHPNDSAALYSTSWAPQKGATSFSPHLLTTVPPA
ncbi:hypothetical protein BDY21DRAFT_358406 [Lineolata rhizophorae]|uniref:Uncharacterized protein n=1 Tax=Lineolata rhizophorae TaxID=578093 RepID=A0A6A6NLR7_9PEZI|nr:hypothetical protein BDY21DRAFT_358406 [Lineolata rhizophorae]